MANPQIDIRTVATTEVFPQNLPVTYADAVRLAEGVKIRFDTKEPIGKHVLVSPDVATQLVASLQRALEVTE